MQGGFTAGTVESSETLDSSKMGTAFIFSDLQALAPDEIYLIKIKFEDSPGRAYAALKVNVGPIVLGLVLQSQHSGVIIALPFLSEMPKGDMLSHFSGFTLINTHGLIQAWPWGSGGVRCLVQGHFDTPWAGT